MAIPPADPATWRDDFEQIAVPHMDALYRSARRMTGNDKDAEDLVQDTFLRAFSAFHQFQRGTNVKAWLFKIMTNLHINRFHQKAHRPQSDSYDGMEEFYLYNRLADNGSKMQLGNPEREFMEKLLDHEVKAALDTLPREFLTAVTLSDLEGLTYQEIADILDVPIGTVRSRLFRGRRLLEKELYEYAKRADYVKQS